MVTCEVRDNKLYLLLFSDLAKYLVEKTDYNVLFCHYDHPSFKVTKENFDWCNELNLKARETHRFGHEFILELELPELKIESTSDGYRLNSRHSLPFMGLSFLDLESWKNKEIEELCKSRGTYRDLDGVIKEVDERLEKLPIKK